eukprot:649158-Pyramimonas_sp.AAC.1
MQEFHGVPWLTYQKWCCGKNPYNGGATATLIRGAEFPGMPFGHDSRSPRRNSQVDPWRWSPENNVVACFK